MKARHAKPPRYLFPVIVIAGLLTGVIPGIMLHGYQGGYDYCLRHHPAVFCEPPPIIG